MPSSLAAHGKPLFARRRMLTGVFVHVMALAGCAAPAARSVRAANQYGSVQPMGGAPMLTGYQFDLGEVVTGDACAEPGTRYEVALAGLSGEPSLGELAAAHAAMGKLKGVDLLLVVRSEGTRTNGRSCGTFTGRAVRLRTVDFPAPLPSHAVPAAAPSHASTPGMEHP